MIQGASLRTTLAGHPRIASAFLGFAAILLGVVAGASVSIGPFWIGWVLLLALLGGYAMLRSALAGVLGVVAVIMLLPFGALPVKVALTPTLLELALAGLLTVWSLRLLARPEYDLRLSMLGGPVLLFLGFTLFSLLIGAKGRPDNLTLHNYVKFVLGVLFFFSVLNSVRLRGEMRWTLRALLGGGACAALLGLALYALNDQTALRLLTALGRIGYPTSGRVLRYVADDPAGLERAIGTSVDPNSFGGMLAPVCALAVAHIWARRPVFPRLAIAAFVAIMAICIFLTYSRGALGGLLVATMFLATIRERRLWYVIAAVMLAGAAAVLLFGIGNQFLERVSEGIQFRDQANQMRLAEFRNAIEIIQRYPVFGVGFGAGPELGLITGVSSIYLAMAERIGLLGLATFLLAMAVFFMQTFAALRRLDEERQSWLLGVQAAVMAALAVGLLDHYYFNIEFSHMAALFWGLIGFGIAILHLEHLEEASGQEVEDGRPDVPSRLLSMERQGQL
jgi:O-antigen ligase